MKNKSRIMSSILAFLTVINMSGCAKKVKCDEPTKHSHLYECAIDDDVKVEKYFNSEKVSEQVGVYEFDRTKYYSLNDTNQKSVVLNNFASISDNYDYLNYLVENGYKDVNDKWIFYAILYDGSAVCSAFDTVEDAELGGFKYFKFDGDISSIIYHEKGKTLTKSIG